MLAIEDIPVDRIPSSMAVVDRELMSLSLGDYIKGAWHIVEELSPFRGGWHIDCMCEHLEAVSRGDIRWLVFNIPPGYMKSLAISVMWPTWEWTKRPQHRYLCVSHAQSLSTRDNDKHRRIVESSWYQMRWPEVGISKTQNEKMRFDSTVGGYRIGTTIGSHSGVMGEHPTRKITDDPHDYQQANSDLHRQKAIDHHDGAMSTRGAGLDAAHVVVMQRLHEDDLSAHLIDGPVPWEVVCLPTRYEPKRWVETCKRSDDPIKPTSLGRYDKRTEEGELLWPEFFTEARVASLELTMTDQEIAGQQQQRPRPLEGALLKRHQLESVEERPHDVVTECRYWDTAATEGGTGARTAGIKMARTRAGRFVITGAVMERVDDPHGLIIDTAKADGRHVRIREETEGGGQAKNMVRLRTLALAGYDYKGVTVSGKGDKVQRFMPFVRQARAGNVAVLEDEWTSEVRGELLGFPVAKLKDIPDAAGGALVELALGPRPARRRVVVAQ